MDKKRIFIAANIPTGVQEAIYGASLIFKDIKGAKIVKPENIHITLAFIGDIKTERIEELKGLLENVLFDFSPIEFSGFNCFPHEKACRVAVFEWENKSLRNCVEKLRERLKFANFPVDTKPFRIHTTMARFKYPLRNVPYMDTNMIPRQFYAEGISIMSSILTPKGPIYKKEFTIGGSGNG